MTYHFDIDMSRHFWIGKPIPLSGLRGVGLHTSESGPGATALDVTNYQISVQNDPRRAGSYNTMVDDRTTIRQNTDDWQTWSTGNKGNDILLHLCFVGQAGWSRQQWLDRMPMLERGAAVAAHWLDTYGWPNKRVYANSLPGILGHVDTIPWGGTDHWDPGPSFPYDVFTRLVGERQAGAAQPADKDEPMNAEQDRMLRDIHRELTQRYPSRSRYRTSDDPIDTLAGFVLNSDARAHEAMVERAAIAGDKDSIEQVREAADRGDHIAQTVADIIDEREN